MATSSTKLNFGDSDRKFQKRWTDQDFFCNLKTIQFVMKVWPVKQPAKLLWPFARKGWTPLM